MKKTTITVTVILVVAVVALVGVYAVMAGRARTEAQEASLSTTQKLLLRNLSIDYPGTPREVIKYYSSVVKCFYASNTTDEELEQLGLKVRELYDEELLEINPVGTYLINLKDEIQDFRDKKQVITSVAVASSVNVDFFEEDGFKFARLTCGYNVRQGGYTGTTSQVVLYYLLRKDESGRWKIYGWENAENVNIE